MQVSIVPGLLQRLVYYACALYVDQLEAGSSYATLRPAISICLLPKLLLREVLPGAAFEQAITALESIAAKTEDRAMYDQREKAQRDYRWQLDSAREEGRVKGLEEGHGKGLEEGREEGVEIGALVGKIQLLQQLVGETCDSTASLAQRPTSALVTLLADLQQRLRARERDPDSPSC